MRHRTWVAIQPGSALITIAILALTVVLAFALPASAQNPFTIDGTVTDANNSGIPGAAKTTDPHLNTKELGPINSNLTKVGVINSAPTPMLGFTNPNGQVDLNTIYTQTAISGGHIWYYFGWIRDANTGSGFLAIEMQHAAVGTGCVYDAAGIDQVLPQSTAETTLINSCNPWANRQTGDFLILWDQSGNDTTIYKRVFTCSGTACTLGSQVAMGTAVAQFSTDGFRGELAIDMSVDVFSGTGCESIANTIPTTVTGNSDSADYKDTVLAAFEPISTCGSVTVVKYTYDPQDNRIDTLSGTFKYTLARQGGAALRYASDAVDYPDDTTTQIQRTLTTDGDSETHPELIAGTNYTLSEDTTLLGGVWTLVSITCTVAGSSTEYLSPNIPVVVDKVTTCIIKNKYLPTTPSETTAQTVRLYDSITITGIQPTASPASTVTFKLFSDSGCTTQVGSNITADIAYNATGTQGTASISLANGISKGVTGTWYWRVVYPGDLLNNGFTTACGDESTTVVFVQ